MEEQHPQQPNRERFNDDPAALMGLPPLEKISEFWKRYDRLADITDEKMTSNLSENLDVLLIFAALFSAINTAFISLTMPALSSDPLAETNTLLRLLVTKADNNTLVPADLSPAFSPSSNSIIVNCLLYASLSCSLLAAVGAMMAKEWLQSFDRTGQTGPLEEQGRFRQRKYNGVQRWHLEAIIQFLPNLLLLSVMLFFAGVYLFLLPVNKAAAGVVIAFSGGGAVLRGVTIVAGAISPLCPYQSAASRALRRIGFLFSLRWWRRLSRTVVDLAVQKPSKFILRMFDARQHSSGNVSTHLELVPSAPFSTTLPGASTPEDIVTAQAAHWLLGTTSNRGDQIAAAQFICTHHNTACALALEDSGTWRRLVSLTRAAFDIWHSQPSERNQEIAELFGLATCHVLLRFSNAPVKRKVLTDLLLYQSRSFGGDFLQALEFAVTRYPCRMPGEEEYILHAAFLSTILNRGSVIRQYQWSKLSQVFSVTRTHHMADVLLGMWAIYFCYMGSDRGRAHRSWTLEDLMEVGENKSTLAQIFLDAVVSGSRVLPLVQGDLQSEINAVRGYSCCLRRVLDLSPQISRGGRGGAAHGVADLMLSYIGPLASSVSGECSSELVRLSIEAVFALHGLIEQRPSANNIPVSQDSESEQLLNDHLINTVVDTMSDGFKSLTSPELLPRTHRVRVQVLNLAPLGERRSQAQQDLEERRREMETLRQEIEGWEPLRLEGLEGVMQRGRLAQQAREGQQEQREWLRRLRQLGRLGRQDLDPLERQEQLDLLEQLQRQEQQEQQERLERQERLEMQDRGERHELQERHELLKQLLELEHGLARGLELDRAMALAQGLVLQLVVLERALQLLVESCITRILLWVWKRTPRAKLDHSASCKIFISSCRLWAPLETTVDLVKNGVKTGSTGNRLTAFDDDNQGKLLTSDDLKRIVEFIEYLQKDRKKSDFIARNADVGINRLYVHLDQRVDWNYELYDLREPHTLCSLSINTDNGML